MRSFETCTRAPASSRPTASATDTIDLADAVSTQWVGKVRASGRVVRGPDRKNLPRCRLRIEVRQWVAR